MSEERAPLARVRLMDGRELVITPDAARVGDRTHLIARIEEARMLFLRPETIGLRMSDVGLVEYTVARPGDGQVALDAIYQARPELLRPDLEPPAPEAPPGFHVPTAPEEQEEPFGLAAPTAQPLATPPAAPGMYPPRPQARVASPYATYPSYAPIIPGPAPFPPQVEQAYGPRPNQRYATLTPAPRTAGQLISATFRLVTQRIGPFLALTFLIVFLPNLALGGLTVTIALLSGQNPFAAQPDPLIQFQQALSGQTPATTSTAATPTDTLVGILSLVVIIATLLLDGWAVAAMTVAAREAALGRRVHVAGCAREGWARLWPTVLAMIVTNFILILIAVPGLGFSLGMILSVVYPQPGQPALPAGSEVVIGVMAGGLAVISLALLAWIWPRVALAPAAAALGNPRPIRSAWSLARGGAWRILIALLVIGVVTSALNIPATLSQFYSNGWAVLLFIPVAQMIAAPLSALVRTLAIYDQRLRREGYTLFQHESVTPPAGPEAIAQDAAAEPK